MKHRNKQSQHSQRQWLKPTNKGVSCLRIVPSHAHSNVHVSLGRGEEDSHQPENDVSRPILQMPCAALPQRPFFPAVYGVPEPEPEGEPEGGPEGGPEAEAEAELEAEPADEP